MDLQVGEDLSDIVQQLHDAGYVKGQLLQIDKATLDSTSWVTYTALEANDVIRVAYVSDDSQLLIHKTFSAEDQELNGGSAASLTEMLSNYVAGNKRITAAKDDWQRYAMCAAGVGAVVGLALERMPGMVVGSIGAAIIAQVPRAYFVHQAETALDAYLTNHNILAGKQAMESLKHKE